MAPPPRKLSSPSSPPSRASPAPPAPPPTSPKPTDQLAPPAPVAATKAKSVEPEPPKSQAVEPQVLESQYISGLLIPADPENIMNMDALEQILSLDDEDDEDHEFSKGLVWDYFTQAEDTFIKMDTALAAKNLKQLSELGHYLKGSSAALGVEMVQTSCERIQHYGVLRDEEAKEDLSEEVALEKLESVLKSVKVQYKKSETWLKTLYGESASSTAPPHS